MSQTATSPRFPSAGSTRPCTSSRHNSSNNNIPIMSALKTPRIPPTSPLHATIPQSSGSPNYFGLQTNDSNAFLTGTSGQHAKNNWSPPSSAVRSAAAFSPTVIPVDQRPEFAAFRKQSDGKVFNLGDLGAFHGGGGGGSGSSSTGGGGGASGNGTTSSKGVPRPGVATRTASRDIIAHATRTSRSRQSSIDSGRLGVAQASPKRVLSPGSLQSQEQARRSNPATNERSDTASPASYLSSPQPRMGLPLERTSISGSAVPRPYSGSTPSDSDTESQFLPASQLAKILQSDDEDSYILLDLRVSTQYATSHISGALNLCIPTTLLKRPAFNLQKLADTFKDDEQKVRFEQWQRCKYIVVYDNASSQLKDAAVCVNTIKKFQTEGYTGSLCILQGGFLAFSRSYPAHVELSSNSPSSSPDRQLSDSDGPEVAPVAGGCPMPDITDAPVNPFFGNIRQNMDLIGGVGQITLHHPRRATREVESGFPAWLRQAADDIDQGAQVAKKFELIERREKKRMEDALSGKVAWGEPLDAADADSVRIAGLEKGSKNRYNNIYPFEHSRVKLEGVPSHGCDYVNASHIKAAWSNKRYISTQAPIPATFADFWSVVWQQDVRLLVMLTAEQEGAQVKAHNYWKAGRYGSLHLDFLSERKASIDTEKIRRRRRTRTTANRQSGTSPILAEIKDEKPADQPHVVVRRFTLKHEGQPFERMREVTQVQYSGWPDLGTVDPTHLIGLVSQCDAVVRSTDKTSINEPAVDNSRPVLVHCSAGCGRTGTFCTVDSVIDMLKRQRAVQRQRVARATSPMDLDRTPVKAAATGDSPDFFTSQGSLEGGKRDSLSRTEWLDRDDLDLIEKTVEDFRLQRISMVQSLRQFVLCYESIMEWLVEQELDERDHAGHT